MSDKKFEVIGTEIGKLVDEKNAAYGDSFAKSGAIMRILYPGGIKAEQIDDALAIVRILDKLFRIATKKDAFGESPFRDIAGYGILGAMRSEKRSEQREPQSVHCGQRWSVPGAGVHVCRLHNGHAGDHIWTPVDEPEQAQPKIVGACGLRKQMISIEDRTVHDYSCTLVAGHQTLCHYERTGK